MYRCKLCHKQFNTEENYYEHIEGYDKDHVVPASEIDVEVEPETNE